VGDPVTSTGAPLAAELGPGLLGDIFDGIQRPLRAWAALGGAPFSEPFLGRGVHLPGLDRARRWAFTPAVAEGQVVGPGDVLGTVPEIGQFVHRILVPPGRSGRVVEALAGERTVDEPLVRLEDGSVLTLLQRWPVREARPVRSRLDPDSPLVTGQRVIDLLFPVALGGTATIPGGFGTGKTVLEQALARFAEVDVVVYVACGERGNELTELFEEFGAGSALAERTVFVANTSNMPIAAREASVYTGLTLAEYYRDQGLAVALMADSTSRWGEALREV